MTPASSTTAAEGAAAAAAAATADPAPAAAAIVTATDAAAAAEARRLAKRVERFGRIAPVTETEAAEKLAKRREKFGLPESVGPFTWDSKRCGVRRVTCKGMRLLNGKKCI